MEKRSLKLLEGLASGSIRPGRSRRWMLPDMSQAEREELSVQEGIRSWRLCSEYTGPTVINYTDMKRRRFVVTGMFYMIDFRTQCREIEHYFKEVVSNQSMTLRGMMESCGPRMPPFYYRWLFDALLFEKSAFGEKSLLIFKNSTSHHEMLKDIFKTKEALISMNKVMES
jgi:hypothetical protein